jgi:hypothetical protein
LLQMVKLRSKLESLLQLPLRLDCLPLAQGQQQYLTDQDSNVALLQQLGFPNNSGAAHTRRN